ncbi:MAG: PepSY-associated TM helix domain-containing protein, partial [Pseudomonadota bacterium]
HGGQTLYKMHYLLHYLPRDVGFRFVGVITFVMFIGLMTGIIIHRQIFKDFFTFRPGKGKRSWLDAHNIFSVSSLPFQLMITYSGLLFVITLWMPLVGLGAFGFDLNKYANLIEELSGHSHLETSGVQNSGLALDKIVDQAGRHMGHENIRFIRIEFPSDQNAQVTVLKHNMSISQFHESMKFQGATGELIEHINKAPLASMSVYNVFIGLHEGLFANVPVRWLYFLSGIAGMIMIATGGIYWHVNRIKNSNHSHQSGGMKLVNQLNIGTFVGLPIAIAAYFLANRLLPYSLNTRADWEIHIMFLTWLFALLYPLIRPSRSAWVELAMLASIACIAIPIVSAITTHRNLVSSVLNHDWVYVGFETTCIFFGVFFAIVSWVVATQIKKNMVPDKEGAIRQKQVNSSI